MTVLWCQIELVGTSSCMGRQASFIDRITVMTKFDQKTTNLAICVVLFAVSYALRATGADFGLINYDERINDSARFLTGDLIPSQHFYPPFINYLVGVAFVGLYGFGWVFDMIRTGLPVVSWPYIPAAETPMPCCPRCCFSVWNLEP